MKKRILSILLVCCMVLTMLPTAAFAAVSDSLGNTPEENQAILEQLSALTGGSSDQVLSMLNALGLLDEAGNFKVDQTITLDGQVLTLAAVMELLENPATDLTRIADVDGTPVALGDLNTMIQIEQELQRIKDTYFSGREFTGEALENLNSLMEQLELRGISLQYSASATEPKGVETVDMSGMMSLTLEDLVNNSCKSEAFTVYRGKPVGFSYRIQKGQLSEYIDGVEVSIGETSGVKQSDGSYKLTYEMDGPNSSLGGCKITVKVTTKGALYNDTYSYGDLLGMIEFYDAKNLVFYDGAGYADHCQLKLKKTVPTPEIKKSMTAPGYEKTHENTDVIYRDMLIPLLAKEYTVGGGAENAEFVALSNTIGILEGARNSVRPDSSTKFYQSYQIDASIEFSWSRDDIAAYTGPAPYGSYGSVNPEPYAPFYLTEYKLGETSLNLSGDRKKTLDCTINKGDTVNISLQSTTQNRGDQQYWLPFELYLNADKVCGTQYSSATAKTSGVTAKLVDTDNPTIQSVTAPEGTYASGQHVPITVTFSEFVDLRSARVTINGKEYSAAALSMNNYGVTAMLWYPVQDADDITVTVNGMTGVKDVFDHPLDTSLYQGNSIAKVELKSVLMRNAPTELTATYANGKA